MNRPPPRSTLFPYTPLFRSLAAESDRARQACERPLPPRRPVRELARSGDDHRVVTAAEPRRAARREGEAAPPAELARARLDRKSTRLNSSHANISYAVFCL